MGIINVDFPDTRKLVKSRTDLIYTLNSNCFELAYKYLSLHAANRFPLMNNSTIPPKRV